MLQEHLQGFLRKFPTEFLRTLLPGFPQELLLGILLEFLREFFRNPSGGIPPETAPGAFLGLMADPSGIPPVTHLGFVRWKSSSSFFVAYFMKLPRKFLISGGIPPKVFQETPPSTLSGFLPKFFLGYLRWFLPEFQFSRKSFWKSIKKLLKTFQIEASRWEFLSEF